MVWQGGQLQKLDLRDNLISSLQELAVLAGLPRLQELLLEGGSPGNSICSIPGYRTGVAAALPQLRSLDGRPLAAERHHQPGVHPGPAAAAQELALMQLQAFQPEAQHQATQLASSNPLETGAMHQQPPGLALGNVNTGTAGHGMPIVIHHMPLLPPAPQSDAENIADRLVQRLMKAGGLQGLLGDQTPGLDNRGENDRMASLEARLASLLDERLRPPLVSVENTSALAEQEQPSSKGRVQASREASSKPKETPGRDAATETSIQLHATEELQVSLSASSLV